MNLGYSDFTGVYYELVILMTNYSGFQICNRTQIIMCVFITQNISIITCPKSALALILSTGQQQVFSYKVIILRTASDLKKQLLSKTEAINVKANKKERREN